MSWKKKAMVPLLVSHFVSYPLVLAWDLAVLPLLFHLAQKELPNLTLTEALWLLFRRLFTPSAMAFVVGHVVALPWAFGRAPLGKRIYVVCMALLFAVALVGAAVGWVRLIAM